MNFARERPHGRLPANSGRLACLCDFSGKRYSKSLAAMAEEDDVPQPLLATTGVVTEGNRARWALADRRAHRILEFLWHLADPHDGVAVVVQLEHFGAEPQADPETGANLRIDADFHCRTSRHWVELQIEVSQSAQDEGWQIAVASCAGRPVDFLGDANVAGPVEHAVETDDRFGPRQGGAGTGMAAAAECHMQAGVLPVHLELPGVFELAGISVGGAIGDIQEGAGRDVDAADLRRLFRQSEVALDGALYPQAFLDKIGDETAIIAKAFLEVGAFADYLEGVAEQSHRGFLPGGEQVGGNPGDIERRRHRLVGKGGFRESGEDVPSGIAPAVLDIRREGAV